MELKDVLGEIEADGANLVHERLLEWALTPPLWHAEAVGASTPSGHSSSAAASQSGSRRRRSRPGTRPGGLVRGAGHATTRTWRSRPDTCCAWPLVGPGGKPKVCCTHSRPCSG